VNDAHPATDAGKVITVGGPIDASDLGVALMHEHLLKTITTWLVPPTTPDTDLGAHKPVSYAEARWLRQIPYGSRENALQADWRYVANELRRFKLAGGRTLVDLTSLGFGRDVVGLKAISEEVGLHVVAGAGYYVGQAHPWGTAKASIESLCTEIIRDIIEGVESSGVRCGVIGEVGLSDPVEATEWRVLEAAALAHRETGAAIFIHSLHELRLAPRILDVLIGRYGVDASRIVMCHMDLALSDWGYTEAVLETGVFVLYDHFGRSGAPEQIPNDNRRVDAVKRIVEAGCASQLLLSQDLGIPAHMAAVGGAGYNHLLSVVVPLLRANGVPRQTVVEILVTNPGRLLPLSLKIDRNSFDPRPHLDIRLPSGDAS